MHLHFFDAAVIANSKLGYLHRPVCKIYELIRGHIGLINQGSKLGRIFIKSYFTLFSWFATTWQGGRVDGQYNIIFISNNLLESRNQFPEERNAFVFDHQHGRREVTCKPAIRGTNSYSSYYCPAWQVSKGEEKGFRVGAGIGIYH